MSAAIDETMGEPVTVTPIIKGKPNFPGTPEPDKAVTVIAVFMAKAETTLKSAGRVAGGIELSPLISTRKPVFEFDRNALPWPILQGYRVQLCRTGEVFEVTDIKPDSVARICVHVVQLGRAKE
ncbi:hypothetical protein OZ411_28695 [Bradyrhizobium sp. Arg237L]|uniref:hypothetical protein n=1 Tax=Bradyrhizobium sp. Arg237L TaxID=3003352 RepID=UPI00249E4C89|nr:hypothetical protein [Bradyrhizobium sp. Arg237L]MDI4236796.1 hypothetical protein [Bradyrhizobium sp. Arg237L]